ncbi:Hpt domain protein [Acetobacteraceae bacterium AT-5844]|nr:Hpt domain protein [Acetobacteraceae bacterium AT-5844]
MSAIDPNIAQQLAADLPREVFVGVVRTFEADLGRLAQSMVDAVKAQDLDAYRRCAHGLAGAAGAIGARKLEAMARQAMSIQGEPSASEVLLLGQEAKAALGELLLLLSGQPSVA